MRLGYFSVGLVVSDIAASRAFYESLGFEMVAGDQSRNWVVLQNENARIGLFQGILERNTLTFNPGRDANNAALPDFTDVRDLQKSLKSRGITPYSPIPAADESATGPTCFTLTDPDGHQILIDQRVPSPKKN
ncbi:MAG: VOC family protein [Phycisphaerae bacterium]|nr:VOC family protein [Phycisphaerae bacterium]